MSVGYSTDFIDLLHKSFHINNGRKNSNVIEVWMKMRKVMPEYNFVAELNESFGKNKNYVQDLRKKLIESGTINRKRGCARPKLDNSMSLKQWEKTAQFRTEE